MFNKVALSIRDFVLALIKVSQNRRSLILLMILLSLFIGGCWDQIGIKERAIVIGLGIDKIDGNQPIRLTAQVINLPTLRAGQSGGIGDSGNQLLGETSQPGPSIIIQTSSGQSLADAINNFLKSSSRRMTFTHNRIVVLGMDLAKAGIAEVFESMSRNYQFRATNWIFVAEKTAQEIMKSTTELGTVPAKDMDQMMINLTKDSFISPVNSNEFILHLANEGKSSFAPLVQVKKAAPDDKPRILVEKTAIFKNNRLIDVLTTTESQDLVWLVDNQKGTSLVFPFQTTKNQSASISRVSLRISNGTTRITPQLDKDGFFMKIDCRGTATLYGMNGIKNNPKNMRRIKHIAELIMVKRINQVIRKAKLLKTDFLGFARITNSQYPQEWQRVKYNWDTMFPQVKTSVHFEIGITRFGLDKNAVL